MQVIPASEVEKSGYAKFNMGPHLCVDVPDGWYTMYTMLLLRRKRLSLTNNPMSVRVRKSLFLGRGFTLILFTRMIIMRKTLTSR